MRLIDADAMEKTILDFWGCDPAYCMDLNGWDPARADVCTLERLKNAPTVDAVPVCRCAECKHRPTKPEKYDDGFDLAFPDEVCPCYCDGDPFYSWYPKDDWFCPKGERKGGTSDDL